jgi:hypothetical protein
MKTTIDTAFEGYLHHLDVLDEHLSDLNEHASSSKNVNYTIFKRLFRQELRRKLSNI